MICPGTQSQGLPRFDPAVLKLRIGLVTRSLRVRKGLTGDQGGLWEDAVLEKRPVPWGLSASGVSGAEGCLPSTPLLSNGPGAIRCMDPEGSPPCPALGKPPRHSPQGGQGLWDTCLPRIPCHLLRNQVLENWSSALSWREQVGRAGRGMAFCQGSSWYPLQLIPGVGERSVSSAKRG